MPLKLPQDPRKHERNATIPTLHGKPDSESRRSEPAPMSTARTQNIKDICVFPSPHSFVDLPQQIREHRFRGPAAAGQRSVDGRIVAVVAADVHAGTDTHRAL